MKLFILIMGNKRHNPNLRDVEKRPHSAESSDIECETKLRNVVAD